MTLRVRDYETLKNGVNIPSSELGNPHRTRVPTFPQQPRLLVPDFTTCRIPPKSRSFPDSCAEPLLIHTRKLSFASALPNSGNSLSGNATGRLPGTSKRSSRGCQWSTSALRAGVWASARVPQWSLNPRSHMAQTIWIHKLADAKKTEPDGMDYICEHLFQALTQTGKLTKVEGWNPFQTPPRKTALRTGRCSATRVLRTTTMAT